jgi:magnesium transporter
MLERIKEEFRELIEQRRWTELSSKKREWTDADSIAPDVVDLLHSLDKADRVLFFRSLPRELEAAVFSCLEGESRDALLVDLTDQEARRILANLPPDDRTDLLSELPGELTQRLLNLLGPDDLLEARQLLGYPEDSVGRLMTPDYVAVRRAWMVAQALEHIRMCGKKSEMVDIIYVVDRHWKLLDALPLKDFIFADPQAEVESLMDYSVISLSAYDDREEAVRIIQRYDRVALPVVDSEGVLLGIVTVDDVLDVAEEEFTEDFQRFSAMEPLRQGY